MTIKFFGTVNGNFDSGSPVTRDNSPLLGNTAFSDNFIVAHTPGTGLYTITLNEWIAQFPLVMASPVGASYTDTTQLPPLALVGNMRRANNDEDSAVMFDVTTYPQGGGATRPPADSNFAFTAVSGSRFLVFADEAAEPTYQLKPVLVPSFGEPARDILKTTLEITAGSRSDTYNVDGATRVIVVSQAPITVTLDDTDPTVEDYTIQVFNFQPGSNRGIPWTIPSGQTPPVPVQATLSPPGSGVLTVPHQVIVSATNNSTGVIIWSDPVIRLSKAAPDGIVPERPS